MQKKKELLNNLPDSEILLRDFLEDDVSFTEESLSCIRGKCGETACHVIYELFGKGRTQLNITFEMEISHR